MTHNFYLHKINNDTYALFFKHPQDLWYEYCCIYHDDPTGDKLMHSTARQSKLIYSHTGTMPKKAKSILINIANIIPDKALYIMKYPIEGDWPTNFVYEDEGKHVILNEKDFHKFHKLQEYYYEKRPDLLPNTIGHILQFFVSLIVCYLTLRCFMTIGHNIYGMATHTTALNIWPSASLLVDWLIGMFFMIGGPLPGFVDFNGFQGAHTPYRFASMAIISYLVLVIAPIIAPYLPVSKLIINAIYIISCILIIIYNQINTQLKPEDKLVMYWKRYND